MRKAAVIVLIEVSGLGLVFGPAVRGRRGKRGQFSGYIIIILGVYSNAPLEAIKRLHAGVRTQGAAQRLLTTHATIVAKLKPSA